MNKIRYRLLWLFLIIGAASGLIIYRLVQLQYTQAEYYASQAKKLHIESRVIPAKRGRILDSGGDVLAISSDTYRILAKLDDLDVTATRESLGAVREVVDFDVEAVMVKLIEAGQGQFVVVRSDISKTDADLVETKLRRYGISNVVVDTKKSRTYPFGSLSSHVIGLTNADGAGYLGVELYYNDRLSGTPGEEHRTVDGKRTPLPYGFHEIVYPKDGEDLYLTTKNSIQFFVEHSVKAMQEELGSKSISVVVSNIKNNSILAMVTYPSFSLSRPYDFGEDMDEAKWDKLTDQERTDYYYQNRWLNRIISSIYEPGSVMKTIVTAIALEEGLINEETQFYCGGVRQVADQELKCISYPDGHGHQNLEEAFVNSCNVYYMQVSELIGRERLYKYFRKLHLLEPSGIDLPNESAPFYVAERDVGEVELATLGYGHAISINMMNMVSAVSAIVNGGYYFPPYIATDEQARPIREGAGSGEKVFSYQTCEIMKRLMEAQAQRSVLKNEHIRIGGKSGTTVKVVDGEYDDKTVISSYIAFAPMENPTYCVYVIIDEPDIEKHGLSTPYRLVKQIFADIFRLYSIDTGSRTESTSVPDLVGGTLDWAEEVAGWSGLEVSTNPPIIDAEEKQQYIVVDQYPAPGTMVRDGFVIIVNIEKREEQE